MEATWRIIGDDGLHYGPVPFGTLREWAREGRVVPETAVRRGDGAFRAASTWPELTVLFDPGAAGPHAPPLPEGSPPVAGAAVLPDDFRIGDFYREAWRVLSLEDIAVLGVMALVLSLVPAIPWIGYIAMFLLAGTFWFGIWKGVLGRLDGRRARFEDFLAGFGRFGDTFLAWVLQLILIPLGLAVFLVPGILLAILWVFTFPVLVDGGSDFWSAMKRSADLTRGYRWDLLAMILVSFALLLAGVLAFGIGQYFVLPVNLAAFGLAYRFLQRRAAAAAPA